MGLVAKQTEFLDKLKQEIEKIEEEETKKRLKEIIEKYKQ